MVNLRDKIKYCGVLIMYAVRIVITFSLYEVLIAILILTCGLLMLVVLCTFIGRKFHIPVKTPKWPACLIFAGTCHGQ